MLTRSDGMATHQFLQISTVMALSYCQNFFQLHILPVKEIMLCVKPVPRIYFMWRVLNKQCLLHISFLQHVSSTIITYLKLVLVISVGNMIYNSQEDIFPQERYQAM